MRNSKKNKNLFDILNYKFLGNSTRKANRVWRKQMTRDYKRSEKQLYTTKKILDSLD
jgi:hypothetical protein